MTLPTSVTVLIVAWLTRNGPIKCTGPERVALEYAVQQALTAANHFCNDVKKTVEAQLRVYRGIICPKLTPRTYVQKALGADTARSQIETKASNAKWNPINNPKAAAKTARETLQRNLAFIAANPNLDRLLLSPAAIIAEVCRLWDHVPMAILGWSTLKKAIELEDARFLTKRGATPKYDAAGNQTNVLARNRPRAFGWHRPESQVPREQVRDEECVHPFQPLALQRSQNRGWFAEPCPAPRPRKAPPPQVRHGSDHSELQGGRPQRPHLRWHHRLQANHCAVAYDEDRRQACSHPALNADPTTTASMLARVCSPRASHPVHRARRAGCY